MINFSDAQIGFVIQLKINTYLMLCQFWNWIQCENIHTQISLFICSTVEIIHLRIRDEYNKYMWKKRYWSDKNFVRDSLNTEAPINQQPINYTRWPKSTIDNRTNTRYTYNTLWSRTNVPFCIVIDHSLIIDFLYARWRSWNGFSWSYHFQSKKHCKSFSTNKTSSRA